MITQKRQFLYQPSPLGSIICWSWTLVLFFIGVILWLEVTHFQWITLLFFVLFALVCWAEVHFRHILVVGDHLIVSRITNRNWLNINLSEISDITSTKHQLGFVARTKIYSFILPANSVIELKEIMEFKQNPEEDN